MLERGVRRKALPTSCDVSAPPDHLGTNELRRTAHVGAGSQAKSLTYVMRNPLRQFT